MFAACRASGIAVPLVPLAIEARRARCQPLKRKRAVSVREAGAGAALDGWLAVGVRGVPDGGKRSNKVPTLARQLLDGSWKAARKQSPNWALVMTELGPRRQAHRLTLATVSGATISAMWSRYVLMAAPRLHAKVIRSVEEW